MNNVNEGLVDVLLLVASISTQVIKLEDYRIAALLVAKGTHVLQTLSKSERAALTKTKKHLVHASSSPFRADV